MRARIFYSEILKILFSVFKMNLPTIAAKIPPRIGATMNTHS